jgi:PAS domain S-box-containing protein
MSKANRPVLQEFSLINSESFFKAVMDQSANLIVITDTKGNIQYVNERFRQLSKYSDEELIGQHTRISKSGEQPPEFYRNMWDLILSGKVFRGQFKNRAKDGSFYWVNTTITPLKDSDGTIKYFLAVSENITYQKVLDERFVIPVEFYKLLLKHLPHTGILITTENDLVSMAEGEVLSLLTVKNRVNAGHKTSDFLQEVGLGEINRHLPLVFKNKKMTTIGIELPHISLRIQLIPMADIDETTDHVMILFHDVSQYVKLLRESQSNQKRLETLFSNAGVGVAIIDKDGFFKKTNQTWNQLAKIENDDEVGKNIKEIVFNGDYLSLVQQMIDLEKGRIKSFRTEMRLQNVKSEPRWIDLSVSSMFDEKENDILFIAMAADIDDAKNAQNQLVERERLLDEMNRSKDKMFSILSHDLRNPFSSLIGFSEHIITNFDDLTPEQIRNFVSIIHNSAENTFALLENLLDWSRAQRGKIEWSPKSLSLDKVVDIAINQVSSAAEKKEIEIDNHVKKSIIAFFDPNMIGTVVRNLVSNAIKFSHRGSRISINAVLEKNRVIVSVVDTGKGIPSENIENIFKVGHIESAYGTENEPGTGLGLNLCKEFVSLNKGEIWVESQEGVGSTFYFSLPIVG